MIRANGRPAPQGSKELGTGGALLESSAYLPAWRQAVRIAAFRAYAGAGISPAGLPLYPAGRVVRFERIVFVVTEQQCRCDGTDEPIGTPDVDKLLRGTLDALGGSKDPKHSARLYADDSQVKTIGLLDKTRPMNIAGYERPGAVIVVAPADWES
jgi:hypothetical protein